MKTVYVGIDMGWKSFRYEIRSSRNQLIKKGGAAATPEELKKVLEKYADQVKMKVAFEAGAQMFWIDRVVKEMGQESYPFHAADFQLVVKSKNKTDKKDAEKIAIGAVKESLPPRVYVPGPGEREMRERITEREGYKKELNACGNRLHALAIGEGIPLEKKSLSAKIENWDAALSRLAGNRREKEAKRWYRQALSLFQLLEEIEEAIEEQIGGGEMGEARRRLETIPGIGFWTAATILAWSGPRASRFATSRKAASYFGLTRRMYESGSLSRPGHIAKTGPALVRKMMTQAAWAFIRSREGRNSPWGQWQHRMTSRNPERRKKAAIALARKLLTAAIACLRGETNWDPERLKRVS